MAEPYKQPTSIPDRNELMQQLLDENGTNQPKPSPTPAPAKVSLGQMFMHLLGLGK
jgi:hypothetical protein